MVGGKWLCNGWKIKNIDRVGSIVKSKKKLNLKKKI